MDRNHLKAAGVTLLVAITAFVGCSFHNNGTGLVDVDGGGPSGTGTNPSATATTNPTTTGTATSSSTGSSTSGTCPPPTVDSSQFPQWKAPIQIPGACDASDLANINTAIMQTNPTFTSIYNSIVAQSCKTCVFSNKTDANWQPIVWDPDMATGKGNGIQNFGACYAVAPNGSAACGKGQQDFQFCANIACPTSSCPNQTACLTSASSARGACSSEAAESTTGCGASLQSLSTACSTFIDGVKIVCQ
jgi:hypothetical protein